MQGERRKATECECETTRGSDVDISQTRRTGGVTVSTALFMQDGGTNLPLKHSVPITHNAKCRDNAHRFTFFYRIGQLNVLISVFSTCKRSRLAFEASVSSVFPKNLRGFCVSEGLEVSFLP